MKLTSLFRVVGSLGLFMGLTASESGSLYKRYDNSVALTNIKITLADKAGNALENEVLKNGKPLKKKLEVTDAQVLKLFINARKAKGNDDSTSTSIKLKVAVAIFNHTETGTLTYQPVLSSKIGSYKLFLGVKSYPKFLRKNPGEYRISFLGGGLDQVESVYYDIGTINFNLPKINDDTPSEYGPKPLIEHIFRQPDTLPSSTLSSLFSLLVVSPWAFLLFAWFSLRVNIKEFPLTQITQLIPALGFLVCLAGFPFLAFQYWLSFTLFQTMAYFAPLSFATVLFGRFALANVQSRITRSSK